MASIPNNLLDMAEFGDFYWKRFSADLYFDQKAAQFVHVQILRQSCTGRSHSRLVCLVAREKTMHLSEEAKVKD